MRERERGKREKGEGETKAITRYKTRFIFFDFNHSDVQGTAQSPSIRVHNTIYRVLKNTGKLFFKKYAVTLHLK